MSEATPVTAEQARTTYLSSLALKLLPEMRVAIQGGKLTKESGWRNVLEHCFASAVAADIFADALNLPADERQKLVSTSAVSDWNKRLEKRSEEFTEEEQAFARELLAQVGPDEALLSATGPAFFVRVFQEAQGGAAVPFREKLMNYIDNITDESTWTTVDIRIPKVMNRWKNLDEIYSPQLGGKGFVEFAVASEHVFEEVLLERLNENLRAKGRPEILAATDIPNWLESELTRRAQEYAAEK